MEITKPLLKTIGHIEEISNILEVICDTTGMGFAAVACITDTQWIACAVRDEINFGLKAGRGLVLETTLCNEIRQHYKPIVIDHVEKDVFYRSHHAPRIYGFQSCISVPIFFKNGKFFGVLCAIHSEPSNLKNSSAEKMFMLFSGVIATQLEKHWTA